MTEQTVLLQILLIFIIPVVLAYLGIIPVKIRLWLFLILFFLVIGVSYFERMSFDELGIRWDNFYESLVPYLLLTILGVTLIIIVAKLLNKNIHPRWWENPHFQFMFIFLSIAQEFMYRGFLMLKLELVISSVFFVVILNTLIYMFLHIIYPNKASNLSLTFLGGLAFATVYYYYPNLILISISHAILNFFAVLYGLVGFGSASKLNKAWNK